MLSEKLEQLLNEQMNYEFESAYLYLAMATDAATKGLNGAANWLTVQYEEELIHSFKIKDYLLQNGCTPKFSGVTFKHVDYKDLHQILSTSLAAEKKVTALINNIMKEAYAEGNFAVISFINWYIDEQIEEEANVNDLIERLSLYTDANIILFDNELAKRKLNQEG
jgi:ferritin